MPYLLILFLVGVIGVLFGLVKSILSATYTKRHLVCRNRYGAYRIGIVALCGI